MAISLTWKFVEPELDMIAVHEGRVVVIVSSDAKIDQLGRRRIRQIWKSCMMHTSPELVVQNIFFRASVVIFCQKLFNYLDSGPSVTEII